MGNYQQKGREEKMNRLGTRKAAMKRKEKNEHTDTHLASEDTADRNGTPVCIYTS